MSVLKLLESREPLIEVSFWTAFRAHKAASGRASRARRDMKDNIRTSAARASREDGEHFASHAVRNADEAIKRDRQSKRFLDYAKRKSAGARKAAGIGVLGIGAVGAYKGAKLAYKGVKKLYHKVRGISEAGRIGSFLKKHGGKLSFAAGYGLSKLAAMRRPKVKSGRVRTGGLGGSFHSRDPLGDNVASRRISAGRGRHIAAGVGALGLHTIGRVVKDTLSGRQFSVGHLPTRQRTTRAGKIITTSPVKQVAPGVGTFLGAIGGYTAGRLSRLGAGKSMLLSVGGAKIGRYVGRAVSRAVSGKAVTKRPTTMPKLKNNADYGVTARRLGALGGAAIGAALGHKRYPAAAAYSAGAGAVAGGVGAHYAHKLGKKIVNKLRRKK